MRKLGPLEMSMAASPHAVGVSFQLVNAPAEVGMRSLMETSEIVVGLDIGTTKVAPSWARSTPTASPSSGSETSLAGGCARASSPTSTGPSRRSEAVEAPRPWPASRSVPSTPASAAATSGRDSRRRRGHRRRRGDAARRRAGARRRARDPRRRRPADPPRAAARVTWSTTRTASATRSG